METKQPLGGRVLTGPFAFFLILFLIGAFFTAKRFMLGIGAVSNMSDGYPWGIWIALDDGLGTALACGGYAITLLVYACNRMEYHPLVRPALLTSLFGYTLGVVSVIIDLGRYWQAYNLILPWYTNFNSLMLEVALCITAYILVLFIEFASPLGTADHRRKKLSGVLLVVVGLGLLLPTMHQSALGSLMLMAGHKLSPLWQTSFLPLLFMLTALIIGFAVVIYESLFSATTYQLPQETPLLAKLATVTFWCLLLLLVIRLGDIILRGYLPLAFDGSLVSNIFLLENAFLLAGFFLLLSPANRQSPKVLFLVATCLLMGGGLYRFNTFITGFDPGNGWQYFPSVSELFITLGIVSLEILGYMWCVKRFPILTAHPVPQAPTH